MAKILDFKFYSNGDGLSSTDHLASPSYAHADRMPAIRDHPTASTCMCGHEQAYSTSLAKLKAALRDKMTGKLRQLTGNSNAKMRWSKKGYTLGVIVRSGHHLRSWPMYANIPFADPSMIPGGQPTMRFLLALWDVGILRFEPATAEEIDLARCNPYAVLPGTPPVLVAPFCWSPFGRNDIGLGRLRPKTNPLGLPLRHPKNGPKTPKLLLDSDQENDEISEMEAEIQ